MRPQGFLSSLLRNYAGRGARRSALPWVLVPGSPPGPHWPAGSKKSEVAEATQAARPGPGAHPLFFPGSGSPTWRESPAAERGEPGRGGRADGDSLTCLQLSLPRCCPGVSARSNPYRQLRFAKCGLAPPGKRREPAKARRAQFLQRGPPELGKGDAMNSTREVSIESTPAKDRNDCSNLQFPL